jgi:hypothetical protein
MPCSYYSPHHREPRLRAIPDRREIALGSDRTVDLPCPQAIRDLRRQHQGAHGIDPAGGDGNRRAHQANATKLFKPAA